MKKAKRIRELEEKLKESKSTIVVPMDKMNIFRVIEKEKYINWVYDHLKGVAKEVLVDKLSLIFDNVYELLNKLENTLLTKEKQFIEGIVEDESSPYTKIAYQRP